MDAEVINPLLARPYLAPSAEDSPGNPGGRLRYSGAAGAAVAAASLTTALVGVNNDLIYTAVVFGPNGNSITVKYLNPAAPDIPLSVSVVLNAITVTLATDSMSVITSTASAVRTAVLAFPAAAALVGVANAVGNDGSGVVTAMDDGMGAGLPLTGGVRDLIAIAAMAIGDKITAVLRFLNTAGVLTSVDELTDNVNSVEAGGLRLLDETTDGDPLLVVWLDRE